MNHIPDVGKMALTDRIEAALDRLAGDRERDLDTLLDPAAILAKVCQEAARRSKWRGTTVGFEMKVLTGHGAKMSQAIYDVYSPRSS